jgi:hypothetical protein
MDKLNLTQISQELYRKLIHHEIFAVSNNIILAKNKDTEEWCIAEFQRGSFEFHYCDKNEANLIFNDYLNQLIYSDEAKINLELLK